MVDLTLSLGELRAQVRCETELSVDLALNEASLVVEVAGFQPELRGIFRFGDNELFLFFLSSLALQHNNGLLVGLILLKGGPYPGSA